MEFPAIEYLLVFWLRKALGDFYQKLDIADEQVASTKIAEEKLKAAGFTLYQVKDETKLAYVTAIAFPLSKWWSKPTKDVATEIALKLRGLIDACHLHKGQYSIEVVPPGWIHVRLSDAGIATWLQYWTQIHPGVEQGGWGDGGTRRRGDAETRGINIFPFPFPSSLKTVPSSNIFSIQYAHARCCSLLRLAHREGTIALLEPDRDSSPAYWSLVAPNPIPWLTADNQLRLRHPAEKSLIYSIANIWDALYCPRNAIAWEKLAVALSQSFEKFYSQCRMWGEVKTEAPELVEARLGLVIATQVLLRLLLEEILGFPAPLEL